MGLETEYIEYGLQLSIPMIGVSVAYFIRFSRPETFLVLGLIPVLYGYTSYISHEGFSESSLMSLPALIFVMTGGLTAVIAVLYSIGNIFVSVFSHGTQFKDFYGSTSLPLLIVGLLTGVSIFAYGSLVSGFQEDVSERVGVEAGGLAAEIVNETGIVQDQKRSQFRLVNSTADLAAGLTLQKVSEDRDVRFGIGYRQETRANISGQVYRRTVKNYEENGNDLSSSLEKTITSQIQRVSFLIVIPIVTAAFYTLQPLIGVLTAIFGKISMLLDG